MKILIKDYDHGFIELIPETIDDLYAIYRILKPGDKFRAVTSRRVKRNNEVGRADAGERVKLIMEVEVEEVEIGDNLSVKGLITAGSEDIISLGSYHTIALNPMEKARIEKEKWSSAEKEIINEIIKESKLAQIMVIVIDQGSVCAALVTQFSVKIITEIEEGITRKFSDSEQHSTAMGNFFQEVHQIIKDITSTYEPQVIVLAGPGFVPENFMEFVERRDQELAKTIQIVHANTGGRVGLHEVLSRNLPEKIAEEQRVVYEMRLLEEFFKRIGKEENTVSYGMKNVKYALEAGAVEILMISDNLLQVYDVEERKKIDKLIDKNKQMGGKTVFFSTMHDTGEKLKSLGGIAALLRYPLEIQ